MLHVVLFEPEIITNTGNIARMCVGFNVKLHLIRPYGFIFDPKRFDKDFIRASANHLDQLMFAEYDDFNDFLNVNKPNQDQLYFYTRYGTKTPNDFNYQNYQANDVYLIFGKESTGIDHEILKQYQQQWVRIPTSINLRSLNIGNSVAIAIFAVLSQFNFDGLLKYEPHKKFE